MTRTTSIFLAALVMACTRGSGVEDSGEATLDWGFDRPSQTPQYTAEELVEHVESWANTYGFTLPQRPFNRYLELMTEGDESCPLNGHLDNTSDFPNLGFLDGCSSSTGWDYIGIAIIFDDDERDEDGYGFVRVGFNLADFVITSPEGDEFSGGGSSKMQVTYSEQGTSWNSEIGGSWEDQTTDETAWLTASGSFDYMMTSNNGQLSTNGYVGVGEYAFLFDHVVVSRDSCVNTPHEGTIWIRQDDGSWNQLTFTDDCTGCATATWNEEIDLGEACIDISEAIEDGWTTMQDIP